MIKRFETCQEYHHFIFNLTSHQPHHLFSTKASFCCGKSCSQRFAETKRKRAELLLCLSHRQIRVLIKITVLQDDNYKHVQ